MTSASLIYKHNLRGYSARLTKLKANYSFQGRRASSSCLRGNGQSGQQLGRHVPDGLQGEAAEDTLVLSPQLHQSLHDPLPADVRVALQQLIGQSVDAAQGAEVLRNAGFPGSGGDADHLLGPDPGAQRQWSNQLNRKNTINKSCSKHYKYTHI